MPNAAREPASPTCSPWPTLRKLPPGTLAAGRPEVRRLEPAGLPDHAQGRGARTKRQLRRVSASTPCATRWPTWQGPRCPQPFGGRYRQIMVYVDPLKLEAHQLSASWTSSATVNDANLILPAGDVRIGPRDYSLYANSQLDDTEEINRRMPLKAVGRSFRAGRRRRRGEGRSADSNERGARRRAAVRLPARSSSKAGDVRTPSRSSTESRTAVRGPRWMCPSSSSRGSFSTSRSSCGKRHRESHARGRHRPDADWRHDPAVSRQRASDRGGVPFHSACPHWRRFSRSALSGEER